MKYILTGLLMAILLAAVGFGAYYFGLRSTGKNTNIIQPQPTVAIKPTTTPAKVAKPDTQKIEAGGVLVFSKYSVEVPSVWNVKQTKGTDLDKLTISIGGYQVSIYQAAGGGGGCLYPGDPDAEMAQRFKAYTEINNASGLVFRRALSNMADEAWTICQKETDGSFGFPTVFGNITITTPQTVNQTTMSQIDSVLASLKKE